MVKEKKGEKRSTVLWNVSSGRLATLSQLVGSTSLDGRVELVRVECWQTERLLMCVYYHSIRQIRQIITLLT
jgi:hypothetical protein